MSHSSSTLTFLLWNINGRDCCKLIGELVDQHRVDVAILLEAGESKRPGLDESPLVESVIASTKFQPTPAVSGKVSILSKNRRHGLEEAYYDPIRRFTLRKLHCFDTSFLLAAVHLPCKLHWTPSDQAAQAIPIATKLRELEEKHGSPGTILLGDFNMNPFEPGMVGALGFHGMMTLDSVAVGERTIQKVRYPFFYNPMWSYFGDRTPGPAGTYFQRQSTPVCYDWNMVDQILVRPSLLSQFDISVEIVSRIGNTELLTKRGRPNNRVGSDHLPVLFQLRKL